ncbi:MAG: AAA family ATPase [Isosphaeraceae bacterium]|nr:AAA family ATPase [Isosphaeraceae bacterium]
MPLLRLNSLSYSERLDQPKQWILDGLRLGQTNLLVGINSTGKTRTLNVIHNLSRMILLHNNFRCANANYNVLFKGDDISLRYLVRVENGKVMQEEVELNSKRLLSRGEGGEGEIFAQEEGKNIRFKPPENDLAVVARRDSLQHPFLEPLHEWAEAVRHYTFGTHLGKDHLAAFVKGAPEADERNANFVVAIFRKGLTRFGDDFVAAVTRDMTGMNYDIETVGLYPPDGVTVMNSTGPMELVGLGVQEQGVSGIVDQNDMSQGMFRALSIITQLNYSQMTQRANCILIDDIGEGLDFDRTVRLIELLRKKAQQSQFQLIMTTNDQFVMNHVPLEDWSVLKRRGDHISVMNYDNSKELFDEFKFVGLSNFAFLELGFAEGLRPEELPSHE